MAGRRMESALILHFDSTFCLLSCEHSIRPFINFKVVEAFSSLLSISFLSSVINEGLDFRSPWALMEILHTVESLLVTLTIWELLVDLKAETG